MKVFTVQQVRELDAFTIAREPVASVDLMERAAAGCTLWLAGNFRPGTSFLVFAGAGNNGGDGLAISRQLLNKGYRVTVCVPEMGLKHSKDFEANFERLKGIPGIEILRPSRAEDLPVPGKETVVIDALFGSGLSRPLSGFAAQVVNHVNIHSTCTVSIDIPSGLFGEDNGNNPGEAIIRARHTLSFQFPKLAFFFAENYAFTGEWHIIPIGLHEEAIRNTDTPYFFQTEEDARTWVRPRGTFSHKGTYGHAFIIAGSHGMMGAAVLAAKSAARAGAGLVTSHLPASSEMIMQVSAPEVIISIDPSKEIFSKVPETGKYTAVAVGPGLGTRRETKEAFVSLLKTWRRPMVLDADALNMIAADTSLLELVPENSILTPHPKEFARLFGHFENPWERLQKAREIAFRYHIILVMKGAYTAIVCPDQTVWFNSTGNPGMATGGSGDVLTGIIAGLLAQGYPPPDAARLGVFVHGLAGDLAARKTGLHALLAGDIAGHLGEAFLLLEK
ncbi:MAG: NAD(P)H-hydrate dehydratase [Bacteroidales bacterium]